MKEIFKNWINKPYYVPKFGTYNLVISIIFGFIVSLFLIIFKPFRIHYFKDNLELFCIGYGTISTLSVMFVLFILPKIFPLYFNKGNRTVLKQIILLNISVFVISSFCWYYNIKIRETINQKVVAGYFEMMVYSYTIGIFPIVIWVYFDELFFRLKREKVSKEIMKNKIIKTKNDEIFEIFGDNNKESLKFKISDLIYITTEGNYAIFITKGENNNIEEQIIRDTLTNINIKLKKFDDIVRCHKSYIINCLYIESISGNARGYFLNLKNNEKIIPVTRKFKKNDLEKLIA